MPENNIINNNEEEKSFNCSQGMATGAQLTDAEHDNKELIISDENADPGTHSKIDQAEKSENNRRLAKNTIALYLRMFFMMGISLYTSRVILQILGVEDFGIYNVVGGIIALFGFLSAALSGASQRFIAHALGGKNVEKQQLVFCTINMVHYILAAIIFVVGETVGLWFLYTKMNIPADRFDAAVWVYHFSIVSSIFGILSSPYNALVIAYEKMNVFAYISILEAILKLGIVFMLLLFEVDKLILYAGLCLAVFASIRMIYTVYCKKRFIETKYKWQIDRELLKNLSTYISWDLIGSLATTMAIQGVNIVLNLFFGPVVNAARTISVQVQGLVQMFAGNFQSAVMPQIIKTYAQGDIVYMHSLIYRSCKLTFVLMFVMILPLLFETPYVLDLWLGQYPQYTVEFVKLSLLVALVDAMATPFMIAVRATGNIKIYSIVTGGLTLLLVPISYVLLRFGFDPTIVLIVHVAISSVCFVARLWIVKPLIQFSIRDFAKKVLVKTILVVILSLPLVIGLHYIEMNKHLMFISSVFVSVFMVFIFSYLFLLDVSEKSFVTNLIKNKINR